MPDMDHPNLMNHCIKVHRQNRKPLIVSALYRHPHTDISFYQHMEDFLIQFNFTTSDFILTGDFNIDYTHIDDSSSAAKSLNDIITTYDLRRS